MNVLAKSKKKQTREEINNNLLLATDDEVRTVFHMAVKCGGLELLQNVWEWANWKLTTGEIKYTVLFARYDEGRNFFYVAA
jgi:hypothetical protein